MIDLLKISETFSTTTDKYAEMFGLPKNKEEMKRIMVSQLGLDNIASDDNKDNNINSDYS